MVNALFCHGIGISRSDLARNIVQRSRRCKMDTKNESSKKRSLEYKLFLAAWWSQSESTLATAAKRCGADGDYRSIADPLALGPPLIKLHGVALSRDAVIYFEDA